MNNYSKKFMFLYPCYRGVIYYLLRCLILKDSPFSRSGKLLGKFQDFFKTLYELCLQLFLGF